MLQADRQTIVIPMGGAFSKGIPYEARSLWLRDRKVEVDSPEGELILDLWRSMEGIQAEIEANPNESDDAED